MSAGRGEESSVYFFISMLGKQWSDAEQISWFLCLQGEKSGHASLPDTEFRGIITVCGEVCAIGRETESDSRTCVCRDKTLEDERRIGENGNCTRWGGNGGEVGSRVHGEYWTAPEDEIKDWLD